MLHISGMILTVLLKLVLKFVKCCVSTGKIRKQNQLNLNKLLSQFLKKILPTPSRQDDDCTVHHAKMGKSPCVSKETKTESVKTVTYTRLDVGHITAPKVGRGLIVTNEREAGFVKLFHKPGQDAYYTANVV